MTELVQAGCGATSSRGGKSFKSLSTNNTSPALSSCLGSLGWRTLRCLSLSLRLQCGPQGTSHQDFRLMKHSLPPSHPFSFPISNLPLCLRLVLSMPRRCAYLSGRRQQSEGPSEQSGKRCHCLQPLTQTLYLST